MTTKEMLNKGYRIYFHAVGVTFPSLAQEGMNRQDLIKFLFEKAPIGIATLHREKDNKYDAYAIRIETTYEGRVYDLGYVPQKNAEISGRGITTSTPLISIYENELNKTFTQNFSKITKCRYNILESAKCDAGKYGNFGVEIVLN